MFQFPQFYLYEVVSESENGENAYYEIIDGLQRLSAINSFLLG